MAKCIFCENDLNADTKPEHILLNALGGRKTTTRVDCSVCNEQFGSTIDKEVGEQVAVLRNMLQLKSGEGRPPPMLRKVSSGNNVINVKNDGSPELVTKPFEVRKIGEDQFEIKINARSIEEIAWCVPHIAAQMGCSVEQVLEGLKPLIASHVERRPDAVHHRLSFGGPLAVRSASKSALALWATIVGNDEVRSQNYEAVRHFILGKNGKFNHSRAHLDSRYLPQDKQLQERFGKFFNLIYVRSNAVGRVVGHFTLYNLISWQILLAETGGTPNVRVGLISNPLDPSKWSDRIAEEIVVSFKWLNNPDYTDGFKRVRERLSAILEHYVGTGQEKEIGRIVGSVFDKHGISDEPVTDPSLQRRIFGEISDRLAKHMLELPHVEPLTGEDIVARVRELRDKSK